MISFFDSQLQEDSVVVLSRFGVGENLDPYKVVNHAYKINFYRCTTVRPAVGWEGVEYGFKLISHSLIDKGECKGLLTVGMYFV